MGGKQGTTVWSASLMYIIVEMYRKNEIIARLLALRVPLIAIS